MVASKQAAGASKHTFEDLTYVGKSTLGDLTKTAKEAAAKKGLVKSDPNQQSPPPTTISTTAAGGKDFFSSISSDMNTIAHSTSSMFSGLFGDKNKQKNQPQQHQQHQQQQKPKESSKITFDSFPGRKALVERSPLLKHSGPKQTQEELQRLQNAERSSSNSENQAFLKDVVHQVLAGEGVGWLKFNRLKKLMEDESYRMLVLGKLNKTLDRKIAPDDHIDDVCIPKPVWKGTLKCMLAMASGLEQTYQNNAAGGMASVFQMMEIAHTHYWSKELNDGSSDMSASLLSSQSVSPMGSRENLKSSPQSPTDPSSRKNSMADPQSSRRPSEHEPSEAQTQSTSEMFKDMLTQKRNVLMSKLTSFDSDVSQNHFYIHYKYTFHPPFNSKIKSMS